MPGELGRKARGCSSYQDGLFTFFPSLSPSNRYATKNTVLPDDFKSIFGQKTIYADDMEVPTISEKTAVDIIALLSGHNSNRKFLITNYTRKQVSVESLKGKYLLICCFLFPMFNHCPEAAFCRALIAFYSELPEKDRVNFQMVIVPKMRSGLDPLYQSMFCCQFLSAFPDNCLIIPPSDTYSCDFVCKTLGLSTDMCKAALFIDPEQMVVQHDSGFAYALNYFGAAAFPFTQSHMDKLSRNDEILKARLDIIYKEYKRSYLEQVVLDQLDKCSFPVSLEELLECPSLTNLEDERKQVPVSGFSDKLVGLYIYFDGQFLDELGDVLDDCDNEGRSFEIVLIRLSNRYDPSSILKDVILELEESKISPSNWWTFPFNHKVCQKLWRMCDLDFADKLIIVPPPVDKVRLTDLQAKVGIREFNGVRAFPSTRETILESKLLGLKSITLDDSLINNRSGDLQGKTTVIQDFDGFNGHPFTRETILESKLPVLKSITLDDSLINNRSGDLQGKAVIQNFNGFSAYPFTRETILERKLAALSRVTLESVLKDYDHLVRKKYVTCFTWGEKQGEEKKWTVADLRGKRILLYIDDFDYNPCGSYICDKIHSQYSQIQAKYPDSEVVYAPLCESSCNVEGEVVSKMPWLRLPFFSPRVVEQLLLGNSPPCCVAFGKDGRVCSREAHHQLDRIARLFNNHLRKEIVDELYDLNQDGD